MDLNRATYISCDLLLLLLSFLLYSLGIPQEFPGENIHQCTPQDPWPMRYTFIAVDLDILINQPKLKYFNKSAKTSLRPYNR